MSILKDRLLEYRTLYPRKNTIIDKELLNDLNTFADSCEDDRFNSCANEREKAAIIILGNIPKCYCGNNTKYFRKEKTGPRGTPYGGFYEFCCQSCAKKATSTVEKRKQTTLERFGETSWAKTDLAKETSTVKWSDEKKSKFREELVKTYQAKHGVDFYSQTQEYLDKRSATIQEQSGGRYTNWFQDVAMIKQANLEKYGVESWKQTAEGRIQAATNNCMKDPAVAAKSRLIRMTTNGNYDETLLKILVNKDAMAFKYYIDSVVSVNGFTFRKQIAEHLNLSYSFLNNLFRRFGMGNDYISLGTHMSYEEEDVFNFVRSIYSGPIVRSNRTVIAPQEIDILLPDIKLGIEYDGIHYHSELGGKDKFYHVGKTDAAEAAGYALLHIFSTEWFDPIKKPIWESILRAKIGVINSKIFARKCTLVEIDSVTAKEFFNKSHLSGFISATKYLGLFYGTELVSALSYGPSRFSKSETEIYRFASKLNTIVVGALGKFISVLPKDGLVSFADRRIASNASYSKFFNHRQVCHPSWYGFDTKTYDLQHRWNFTSARLKKLIEYDDTKTVVDNMFDSGYDRIWDCGNWKYMNK